MSGNTTVRSELISMKLIGAQLVVLDRGTVATRQEMNELRKDRWLITLSRAIALSMLRKRTPWSNLP